MLLERMTDFRFPMLRLSADADDWMDLEFGLISHRLEGTHDFHVFRAGARHADRDIAFDVWFPCKWEHDPPDGAPSGFAEHHASMALASAKPLHEPFLQTLSALYGLAGVAGGMAHFVEISAVALEGNPENVLSEAVRLKIFFGAFEDSAVPYAEAYLNLDVPNGTIQFNEKDPEWRANIIHALSVGTVDDLPSGA